MRNDVWRITNRNINRNIETEPALRGFGGRSECLFWVAQKIKKIYDQEDHWILQRELSGAIAFHQIFCIFLLRWIFF